MLCHGDGGRSMSGVLVLLRGHRLLFLHVDHQAQFASGSSWVSPHGRRPGQHRRPRRDGLPTQLLVSTGELQRLQWMFVARDRISDAIRCGLAIAAPLSTPLYTSMHSGAAMGRSLRFRACLIHTRCAIAVHWLQQINPNTCSANIKISFDGVA